MRAFIQYDWPHAAFLLFIVFILGFMLLWLHHRRKTLLSQLGDPAIQQMIIEPRLPFSFWFKAVLLCLTWIMAVLALMQPKGNAHYPTETATPQLSQKTILHKKQHEVIFLVDVSASMGVADLANGNTREAMAKEIVNDIISKLKGNNVSLLAFTSTTISIVPSTLDYLFTRLMLQQLQINEEDTAGTNIRQALEYTLKKYGSLPLEVPKTLILLTDGGDTHIENLEGNMRRQAVDELINPLLHLTEKNWNLITVGIGSTVGGRVPDVLYEGHPIISAIDLPLLQQISSAAQGPLFIANDATALQMAHNISMEIAKDSSYEEKVIRTTSPEDMIYSYYFQIPLGIAICALALILLTPDTAKHTQINSKN